MQKYIGAINPKILMILQWATSIGLLAGLLWVIGVQNILHVFSAVSLGYLVALWLVLLSIICMRAVALYLLTKNISDNVVFIQLFHDQLSSSIAGILTPGSIGKMYIIQLLKKYGITTVGGTALYVMNKAVSQGILVALTIVSIPWMFMQGKMNMAYFIFIAINAMGILLLWWRPYRTAVRKRLPKNICHHISSFSAQFRSVYSEDKMRFYKAVALELLERLMVGVGYCVLFSIYISVTPLVVVKIVLVSTMVVFVSTIPISADGVGTREMIGVYLFSMLGLNSATIVAVILTYHISYKLLNIAMFYVLSYVVNSDKKYVTAAV